MKDAADLVVDIEREVIRAFYQKLERSIAVAMANRQDVAVSTDEWPLRIIFLPPGGELPSGRRWTIYRTAGGMPEGLRPRPQVSRET